MMIIWRFIVGLFLLPLSVFSQDYYAILGVGKNANEKEIKSAYRQLSKKYHPDKNPGDNDAHHKFIEVGEAYEALSDPEKRRIYDQFGAEALKNGGQSRGQNGGFHDPFDIFEQMFGGGGGDFRGGGQRRQKGQSLQVQDEITLQQYYQGTKIQFSLLLNDICDHCHGSGSEDGAVDRCEQCGGRGLVIQVIRQGFMTQQIQHICSKCGGEGELIRNKCHVCSSAKVVKKNKVFDVEIPRGAPRDFVLVKHGEAEKFPNADPGNLYIKVKEADHGNLGYRRRGSDLFRTEVLSLKEALQGGWTRDIEFLDPGKKVRISRPKGRSVQNLEVERITGFGMPIEGNKFGNLYIEYAILLPGSSNSFRFKDEL